MQRLAEEFRTSNEVVHDDLVGSEWGHCGAPVKKASNRLASER
jgi:hypothetical protein